MGEEEWLDPDPDPVARQAAFAEFPEAIQLLPEAEDPGRELAAMLGVDGALPEAAMAHREDMCLLDRREGEQVYRLIGAAVAWPSDWRPVEKIGKPLTAIHAPIQNYAEQLASGVDHFMETLQPGPIYGRCNWFVAATDAMRWVAEPPTRAFAHVTADNAGEKLFIRSERQTLRRLPETGAIAFTIGVYVAPLGSLSADNISRLAKAVTELPGTEENRRGTGAYFSALIGYARNNDNMRLA